MTDLISKEEAQLDIKELESLLQHSTRPRVRQLISKEIEKLNKCEENVAKVIATEATVRPVPAKYYKDILNYAWDQSENYMKIYVTINGVHKIAKENIGTEFTEKSFMLKVDNVDGQNFKCHIAHLWEKIVPGDSYFKVKTDTVLLMLKKEKTAKTWAYVTQKEDKKPPKFDEKKDPNESLMDLMKKMYDEGDDEMKRTIAKSFAESRNKTASGDF